MADPDAREQGEYELKYYAVPRILASKDLERSARETSDSQRDDKKARSDWRWSSAAEGHNADARKCFSLVYGRNLLHVSCALARPTCQSPRRQP